MLLGALRKALGDLDAERILPPALPEPPRGRTVVVGAGKASASMARALEQHWPGDLSGLVAVPHGYALPCERIRVVEATHPMPDDVGLAAARDMMTLVRGLTRDDLVVALFSGGGSALLPLPAGGVTLEDKKSLLLQLLAAGANIKEINCVRKHLSALKGGRLACALGPARLVNLLVSDVAGDDPSVIASGPGVPDPTTLAEARQVVEKYGLRASVAVHRHLADEANETPKPGCACFSRSCTVVLASSQDLLESAARFFEAEGVPAMILSASVEGESVDVALVHAAIARQVAAHGQPAPPPLVLLSGGETTVTQRESGLGGPNAEFLLALALALGEDVEYVALACDTDGVDGGGGIAGAVARSDTLRRAQALGLEASRMLRANDSHAFFEALGDALVTGPTFTNVNDFRAILVFRSSQATRTTKAC
ncbi:MAG: glycerate kinase [Actinobacteria bacterium]|nr:glycerate kinase [Actinomycetota bacterium]